MKRTVSKYSRVGPAVTTTCSGLQMSVLMTAAPV